MTIFLLELLNRLYISTLSLDNSCSLLLKIVVPLMVNLLFIISTLVNIKLLLNER